MFVVVNPENKCYSIITKNKSKKMSFQKLLLFLILKLQISVQVFIFIMWVFRFLFWMTRFCKNIHQQLDELNTTHNIKILTQFVFNTVFYDFSPETLSKKKYDSKECCICLNDNTSPSSWHLRSCHHCFHQDCIKKWIVINPECPVCRTSVFKFMFDEKQI